MTYQMTEEELSIYESFDIKREKPSEHSILIIPIETIQEYRFETNYAIEGKRAQNPQNHKCIDIEKYLLQKYNCKKISSKTKLSLNKMHLKVLNFIYGRNLLEKISKLDKNQSSEEKHIVRTIHESDFEVMSSNHVFSCIDFASLRKLDIEPFIRSTYLMNKLVEFLKDCINLQSL